MLAADAVAQPGLGWPTHFPGLLGPALAAVSVTALADGRPGLRELWRRATRWRIPWPYWALVVGTAGLAVVGGVVLIVTGTAFPPLGDFASYTGIGNLGLVPVILIALLINGFGEETGWRGFAAERLLREHALLATSLLVAAMWDLWHLPLFWVVGSFRAFTFVGVLGWMVGLTAGSVVLTWLYQRSNHSILLVAAWHTAFNLASATEATGGPGAAISSTIVICAAVFIVIHSRHSASEIALVDAPEPTALPAESNDPAHTVDRGSRWSGRFAAARRRPSADIDSRESRWHDDSGVT